MDVTVRLLFSIEGISVGHGYGDSVGHDNCRPAFPGRVRTRPLPGGLRFITTV